MNCVFCTIASRNYLFTSQALFHSLHEVNTDAKLLVLVTDATAGEQIEIPPGIEILRVQDMPETFWKHLVARYKISSHAFRWTLKSILLTYLLIERKFDAAIYLDSDLCFFSNPDFLFNELHENDLLLTPHDYPFDTTHEQNWLEANFRVGLYNAGFVGANSNALYALIWWRDACLYRCEKNALRGLYYDQKYLDLLPIMHERTKVLHHEGCNVASWNHKVRKRQLVENELLIDGKFPVVFVHFSPYTIGEISRGNDALLQPHLAHYVQLLRQYKPGARVEDLSAPMPFAERTKLWLWQQATRIGW